MSSVQGRASKIFYNPQMVTGKKGWKVLPHKDRRVRGIARIQASRLINERIETKKKIYTTQLSGLATATQEVDLTAISDGTLSSERVGAEVRLMSVWLDMQIQIPATKHLRIVMGMVRDHVQVGEITALLPDTNYNRTIDLRKAWIMYDKFYTAGSVLADFTFCKKFKFPYKMRPRVTFSGPAGTDVEDKHVYVWFVSDDDGTVITPRFRTFWKG